MKKSDLKNGMVVEYASGEMRIVMNNGLYYVEGEKLLIGTYLNNFTEDLLSSSYTILSIQKVYKSVTAYNYPKRKDEFLIWERKTWKNVKKDTLVRVQQRNKVYYRYFSRYEDGVVYLFMHGATSLTAQGMEVQYNPEEVEVVEVVELKEKC